MTQALHALEQFLHAPSDLPPIARLALVHYQFEAIHPFLDRNGRIGRLLIALMLCLDGILPEPLLYLSPYFERHRQAYYDGLCEVSRKGEFLAWLRFFAQAVAQEATDTMDRAKRLTDLRTQYIAQVCTPRTAALLTRLIEELFARPALTIDMAVKLLKVTFASAQKHVDRLAQAGIVREITGRRRNRISLAQGILQAIQDPDFGHRP